MKDTLTRRLGPLPVWAWAIIGVSIAAIGYWTFTHRAPGHSDETVNDTTGRAPGTATTPGGSKAPSGGGGSGGGTGGVSLPTETPAPQYDYTDYGSYEDTPFAETPASAPAEHLLQETAPPSYSFGSQTYTNLEEASNAFDQFLMIGGYSPYPAGSYDPAPAPAQQETQPTYTEHEIDPGTGMMVWDPTTGGWL